MYLVVSGGEVLSLGLRVGNEGISLYFVLVRGVLWMWSMVLIHDVIRK